MFTYSQAKAMPQIKRKWFDSSELMSTIPSRVEIGTVFWVLTDRKVRNYFYCFLFDTHLKIYYLTKFVCKLYKYTQYFEITYLYHVSFGYEN